MKRLSTNFKQRLLVSFVGIPLLFAVIYLSHYGIFKILFTTLAAAIIATALWEFYRMTQSKEAKKSFAPLSNGYAPLTNIGLVFSVLYVFATFLSTQVSAAQILPAIVLGLTLLAVFLYYLFKGSDPFLNISATLFGIIYITIPLSCLVNINYFFPAGTTQDGRWWLFYVLAVTKMTDVGGYFFGKLFGKQQMVPFISPRKTWEGSIGGLLASLATSLLFYAISLTTHSSLLLTLGESLFLGFFIGLLAQIGDLAESLLKRDLGVKDSNHLPGLGGVLDILDSLVFTIPFVYIFLKVTHA